MLKFGYAFRNLGMNARRSIVMAALAALVIIVPACGAAEEAINNEVNNATDRARTEASNAVGGVASSVFQGPIEQRLQAMRQKIEEFNRLDQERANQARDRAAVTFGKMRVIYNTIAAEAPLLPGTIPPDISEFINANRDAFARQTP